MRTSDKALGLIKLHCGHDRWNLNVLAEYLVGEMPDTFSVAGARRFIKSMERQGKVLLWDVDVVKPACDQYVGNGTCHCQVCEHDEECHR